MIDGSSASKKNLELFDFHANLSIEQKSHTKRILNTREFSNISSVNNNKDSIDSSIRKFIPIKKR